MSQTPKLRPQLRAVETPVSSTTPHRDPGAMGVGIGIQDDVPVPHFSGRQLVLLLGFTVLAAVLRLTQIGAWSFWIDEAHTYRDVVMPLDQFWTTNTSKYPLSYLLVRYLGEFLGLAPNDMTEGLMRLPFVFFGIASIPALAIAGRAMVGRRTALLAALLLALSPWHIYWSQNARSYSMVLFTALIAMGAAFHGFQRRSILMLTFSVVMFIVAGLCHPSAYAIGAAALLYLSAATYQMRHHDGWTAGKWIPLVLLGILVVIVLAVLPVLQHSTQMKGKTVSLMHFLQTLAFFIGIPVMVAAGGGMLVLFNRGARSAAFLTSMVVLPLLALMVASSVGVFQKVTAQYAIAVLTPALLLAASLLATLGNAFQGVGARVQLLRLIPAAMIIVPLLGQDYLYFAKEHGWRPRWAEAVDEIQVRARRAGVKDLLIMTINEPSVEFYLREERSAAGAAFRSVSVQSIETYSRIRRPGVPDEPLVLFGSNPGSYLKRLTEHAQKNGQDLWVLVTEPGLWEKDKEKRADQYLRRNFRQVRRFPNWTGPKDMTVLVYHFE